MNAELLDEAIVLVLNRNWQAIRVTTVRDALTMMNSSEDTRIGYAATGIDIHYEQDTNGEWKLDEMPDLIPMKWEEWICLPVRNFDESIRTTKLLLRVPSVIIACNYSKVPKKRPKLCAKSIRERDGNRCQYTGRVLRPNEGSLDHIIPRSRNGRDTWENLVWSAKEVNQKKADRLPHEAGLKLLSIPKEPKEIPASATINPFRHRDWRFFFEL